MNFIPVFTFCQCNIMQALIIENLMNTTHKVKHLVKGVTCHVAKKSDLPMNRLFCCQPIPATY